VAGHLRTRLGRDDEAPLEMAAVPFLPLDAQVEAGRSGQASSSTSLPRSASRWSATGRPGS
jgi:hypothetical protein